MKQQYHLIPSIRNIFLLICLLGLQTRFGSLFAQGGVDYGDEQAQKAFAKAVKNYDNYLGKNLSIYTGSGYYNPYIGIKGHPFFMEDYWEPGNVVYDGNFYDSLDLMYDVYSDLLIIENFSMAGLPSPIQLFSPKVQSFQLFGYDFLRLESDSVSNIKEGFYNMIYKGNVAQFLIKREKELAKANEVNNVEEVFSEKDKYYIKKEGIYHLVKRRKSVLKVLEDKSKDIKNFIRAQGFDFRGSPDQQLAEVVKYYDSLF